MAPIIKATFQLLLGLTHTKAPSHIAVEQGPACHDVQSHISGATPGNGPSISAISWGYNRMDVYGNDVETGNVSHKWWDGYQWNPSSAQLELLGGSFKTPPAAISSNTGRMDVFSVGGDNSLYHKYFDGSVWQPSETDWESLSGSLNPAFALSATSWSANRLDVFGLGPDMSIYLKYWDGSSWGPSDGGLENLGGNILSGPAAVSWGANRNDVFAISSSNALVHAYWDGSNWSGWEDLSAGTLFSSTPTAISWGANRLDVFAVNSNGSLTHVWWDGSQWSVEDLGGSQLVGTVAATSWGANRIDIVALGKDAGYYYKYFDGSDWTPSVDDWYPKGGNFSSAPSVVSWGVNRLDIYGVTGDNLLGHQTWYGSGWYPDPVSWEPLGGPLAAYPQSEAESMLITEL